MLTAVDILPFKMLKLDMPENSKKLFLAPITEVVDREIMEKWRLSCYSHDY